MSSKSKKDKNKKRQNKGTKINCENRTKLGRESIISRMNTIDDEFKEEERILDRKNIISLVNSKVTEKGKKEIKINLIPSKLKNRWMN